MIGQRELGRNAPKKRFKLPQGCSSLSLSLSMCTMSMCTVLFFPPKKHFHYSHYTLWEFSFCKAKEPGLCHCPLVQWLGFGVLTMVTQPQSLAVNRSPTSSCCKLKPLEIRNIYILRKGGFIFPGKSPLSFQPDVPMSSVSSVYLSDVRTVETILDELL